MTPTQLAAGFAKAADLARSSAEPVTKSADLLRAETVNNPAFPVRSGTLRRSVVARVETAQAARVGTTLSYARRVHARKPFLDWGLAKALPKMGGLLEAWGRTLLGEIAG